MAALFCRADDRLIAHSSHSPAKAPVQDVAEWTRLRNFAGYGQRRWALEGVQYVQAPKGQVW